MTPEHKEKGWRYVGTAGTRAGSRRASSSRVLPPAGASSRQRKKPPLEETRDEARYRGPDRRLWRRGARAGRKRHSAAEVLVWIAAFVVAAALLVLLGREMPLLGLAGLAVFAFWAWREFG